MQVFLVIVEDGYLDFWPEFAYASLAEAVEAADKVVCNRIECLELGPKGLVAIYDPKGNLQKSFE